MEDTLTFFPYMPLRDDEIRLLSIKPNSLDAQVACSLKQVSLSCAPKFFALSYVWGDATNTKTAIIDQAPFQVTSNLYDALHRIRSRHEIPKSHDDECYVWADAVCIDQHNQDEKAKQVTRMKDIYTRAEKVLIWLGRMHDERDNFLVHQLFYAIDMVVEMANPNPTTDPFLLSSDELGTFYAAIAKETMYYETYARRMEIKVRGQDLRLTDIDIQQAIGLIFGLPWFTRVWVVQEATLPTHSPLVLIGDIVGHLDAFLLFSRNLRSGQLITEPHSGKIALLLSRRLGRSWHNDRVSRVGQLDAISGPERLYRVLGQIGGSSSTLPHDLVYGVLSLADIPKLPDTLTPNYQIPYLNVFHQYSMFLFAETGNLSLLRSPKRALPAGCPTWVLDFRHTWMDSGLNGPQTKGQVSFSPDGTIMFIEGAELGVIRLVLRNHPVLRAAATQELLGYKPDYENQDGVLDSVPETGNFTMAQGMDNPWFGDLTLSLNPEKNRIAEWNQAWKRLGSEWDDDMEIDGYLGDPSTTSLTRYEVLKRSIDAVQQNNRDVPKHDQGQDQAEVDLISRLLPVNLDFMVDEAEHFITQVGSTGSCSYGHRKDAQLAEGDMVCALKGCPVAVILRPKGPCFQVIGTCSGTWDLAGPYDDGFFALNEVKGWALV